MNLEASIKYVSERFEYRADPKFFEYYTVMKDDNGVMRGDCDDFSVTVIWKVCGSNIWNFIWNVLILHRYRLYFSKAKNNAFHLVGKVGEKYFDNWTYRALDKEEFLKATGHKLYFFIPSPLMIIYLILGLFMR